LSRAGALHFVQGDTSNKDKNKNEIKNKSKNNGKLRATIQVKD